MKILVTGSRDWSDEKLMMEALLGRASRNATLIHGDCRGADRLAGEIWSGFGLPVEKYPADWSKHGKRAGFVRNSEMIALKPDLCLAFVKNKSRGAMMTVELCRKAGIPVELYEQ